MALPHRARLEDDEETVRPFPNAIMELVVSLVHPDHRLMFELLAATGVRRSELVAIEARRLALDGERPHVRVQHRCGASAGRGL